MKPAVRTTSDVFVRFLFGSEHNKDLLLSFINSVQEASEFPRLVSVTIKNPFNLKAIRFDKETCLDIKAADEERRTYDVEVQNHAEGFSAGRSLFYWAKLYSKQLRQSHTYRNLNPVICINVLNFSYFPDIDRFFNNFVLREKTDHELVLSDHLQMHFIEIQKHSGILKTQLDRWVYFFRHGHEKENETMRILIKEDPIIFRADEEYENFTRDEELVAAHEAREKYLHDEASRIEDAEAAGMARGMQKGMQKGIERGIAEGIAKGKVEDAKKMKGKGLSIQDIQDITGLSKEQIESL